MFFNKFNIPILKIKKILKKSYFNMFLNKKIKKKQYQKYISRDNCNRTILVQAKILNPPSNNVKSFATLIVGA